VTQLAVVVASMAVCRSSGAEPLRLDPAILGQGAATPCRQMRGSMPDPRELLCLRRELAREVGTTF